MGNPLYLAMTAAEFSGSSEKPAHLGWMACHFSPYGAGLSNIPKQLPTGSLLILNDRIEPGCHDAALIAQQARETVQALECCGVLLDFQRPVNALTMQITTAIAQALPCPLAVSPAYASGLDCAVFLPPPPIRCDPAAYFAPWEGRQIWLEIYDQWETVTITADAVQLDPEPPATKPDLPHWDQAFSCRFKMDILEDRAVFILHRDMEALQALPYPISNFIALWQDYGS